MGTQNFANIFGIGTTELIIILVIILLLFGGKKLPELAKSLGSSIKELRKGVSEGASDDDNKSSDSDKKS